MDRLNRRRPFRRLTAADILSTLALFIALTGGAYAAGVLPANSVGSKQLKKNAVTAPKLAVDSVNGDKVLDGSLKAVDFAADELPAGPKGDTGAGGTPVLDVQSAEASVPDGQAAGATANCPAGETAVAGGASVEAANAGTAGMADSYPEGRTGWTAHGVNVSGSPKKLTVFVECSAAVQTGP